MPKAETLVVEFGDELCRNIYFAPLDRRFRGRFDAQQLARRDRDAGQLMNDWPEPIAGQQLAIDVETGAAEVVEPLHDFPAIAARIKARGFTLAPQRESVTCDLPTMLFYAVSAVKAGKARVVRGALPDSIDESKVRKDLFIQAVESDSNKLASAMTAQAKAFDRLADVLEKLLAKR